MVMLLHGNTVARRSRRRCISLPEFALPGPTVAVNTDSNALTSLPFVAVLEGLDAVGLGSWTSQWPVRQVWQSIECAQTVVRNRTTEEKRLNEDSLRRDSSELVAARVAAVRHVATSGTGRVDAQASL